MSKQTEKLIAIGFMVLLWIVLTISYVFFIDLVRSDYHRSLFAVSDDAYPLMLRLLPLVLGIGLLRLWIKTGG